MDFMWSFETWYWSYMKKTSIEGKKKKFVFEAKELIAQKALGVFLKK